MDARGIAASTTERPLTPYQNFEETERPSTPQRSISEAAFRPGERELLRRSSEDSDRVLTGRLSPQLPKKAKEIKAACRSHLDSVLRNLVLEQISLPTLNLFDPEQPFDAQALFERICRETEWVALSSDVASFFVNSIRNRYVDVKPYDCLRCTVGKQDHYINASPMHLGVSTYIVTQAPLEFTLDDFFKLIKEYGVETIVTLSMPVERRVVRGRIQEQVKGIDYWSSCVQNESVILSDEEQVLVKRRLRLDDQGTEVDQFHLMNTPDMEAPSILLLNELIDRVGYKTPILVHCSAGLGRSGVFVAAHSLTLGLEKSFDIPLARRIYEMRACRKNMVQNVKQLQAIVDSLKARF